MFDRIGNDERAVEKADQWSEPKAKIGAYVWSEPIHRKEPKIRSESAVMIESNDKSEP